MQHRIEVAQKMSILDQQISSCHHFEVSGHFIICPYLLCQNKPKKCDFKILPKMRPKVVFDINHVSSMSYLGDVLTLKVVTEFLFGN